MARRPDILLIVLDTQRADRFGSYGYPRPTTPRLDDLAADATRFAHAISPAHWTVPAHAALFTGLFPTQHTTYQMEAALPEELPTLAERLASAGYHTAGFSQNPLIGVVDNGLDRGFQRFNSRRLVVSGLLNARLNRMEDPGAGLTGLRRLLRVWLAEMLGYSEESALHRLAPLLLPFWRRLLKGTGATKEANTRRLLTAVARLFVQRPGLPPDRPIFAFVNLMGVHIPYDPPAWAVERFLTGLPGAPAAASLLRQANQWQVDARCWLDLAPPADYFQAALNAVYDAEVAAQDAQLGWLFDRLREGGALDRTWLAVTADHGDHLGEKRRVNHVFGAYEPLLHVPLIVRDVTGDLPRGAVVDGAISTRRLFHTILANAGAATAAELPLALTAARSGADLVEPIVFAESHPLDWGMRRVERYRPGLVAAHQYHRLTRAAYEPGFKLIATGDRRELYALAADPAETVDMRASRPEVAARLEAALAAFDAAVQPAAAGATRDEDDAAILDHLRDLGYVE